MTVAGPLARRYDAAALPTERCS